MQAMGWLTIGENITWNSKGQDPWSDMSSLGHNGIPLHHVTDPTYTPMDYRYIPNAADNEHVEQNIRLNKSILYNPCCDMPYVNGFSNDACKVAHVSNHNVAWCSVLCQNYAHIMFQHEHSDRHKENVRWMLK